jgi:hypothetical protein
VPLVSATTAGTPKRARFSSTRPILPEPIAAEGSDIRMAVLTLIKEESRIEAEPIEPDVSIVTKRKPTFTLVIVTDFYT